MACSRANFTLHERFSQLLTVMVQVCQLAGKKGVTRLSQVILCCAAADKMVLVSRNDHRLVLDQNIYCCLQTDFVSDLRCDLVARRHVFL